VSYEFYLNDPAETPEEQLQTQVVFPLKVVWTELSYSFSTRGCIGFVWVPPHYFSGFNSRRWALRIRIFSCPPSVGSALIPVDFPAAKLTFFEPAPTLEKRGMHFAKLVYFEPNMQASEF
jgi:hypothetical protein